VSRFPYSDRQMSQRAGLREKPAGREPIGGNGSMRANNPGPSRFDIPSPQYITERFWFNEAHRPRHFHRGFNPVEQWNCRVATDPRKREVVVNLFSTTCYVLILVGWLTNGMVRPNNNSRFQPTEQLNDIVLRFCAATVSGRKFSEKNFRNEPKSGARSRGVCVSMAAKSCGPNWFDAAVMQHWFLL
jgi:hypothetical protein